MDIDEFVAKTKGRVRLLTGAADVNVEVIPTGVYPVDHAVIKVGGFPRGKITEVYGPEMSGKTTLCLHACAYAQAAGLKVLYMDAEHAMDPAYAAVLGVDLDRLMFCQPMSAEEGFDTILEACANRAADLIVVDSVAALTPQAEHDGDMEKQHMGLHARLMSKGMRKLCGNASASNTSVVFINQTRMKLGVMFGSPVTTTGGNALKFYASLRIEMTKMKTIKTKEQPTGQVTRIRAVKNKMAPPFLAALVDLTYGEGLDGVGWVLDQAVEQGMLTRKGATYDFGEVKARGRAAAVSLLKDDPALVMTLISSLKTGEIIGGDEDE